MKTPKVNKEKVIFLIIGILLGALACFIGLKFTYFEIKTELDVPAILIGGITLALGFYIADSIQRKVSIAQTQHSYLNEKVDTLWSGFHKIDELLSVSENIDATVIKKINEDLISPLKSLIRVWDAYGLSTSDLELLDKKLDNLIDSIEESPIKNNVLNIGLNKEPIKASLKGINEAFSSVMKQVQNM